METGKDELASTMEEAFAEIKRQTAETQSGNVIVRVRF